MTQLRPMQASGFAVAAVLAGCSGDGSDIGPDLPKLPAASCKAVVLDDLGRGVTGATVAVAGSAVRTITGRNGRGDFLANPTGRLSISVDGSAAAAVDGDRLATLRFALDVPGTDLPSVFYLPDLPDSASATLTVGTQTGATSVTSTAGAVLTVPAGSSVGLPSGAPAVVLRVGALQAQHLPADLPVAPTGTFVFGRGIFVDPPSLTFTPPVDLDVDDDLGLGAATAQLYHLDPTTGQWSEVATGAASTGARITLAGAVATGGLYAFGAAAAATTVQGRAVGPAGAPLPDVLVVVDQWKTTTGIDGRFAVDGVAATLANGAPRAAVVELFAGATWLPARQGTTVPVSAASTDAGDIMLDTLPAANVRVQQVLRGRADAFRPVRTSSLLGDVALATTGDANGQSLFEDLPTDWFGFQEGRPIDPFGVFYGQGIDFVDQGRRWHDSFHFLFERPWNLGSRRTRVLVTDSIGGGPLKAAIVRGTVPGEGFLGLTEESGALFDDRDMGGRATASLRTARGSEALVYAFSIERPSGDHLELPLRRVLRPPLARFDRHGLVEGNLTGVDPSREHRLRVTRRISPGEWWADVAEGRPLVSSLPVDVDPAVTHGPFRVGVDAVGGNLAATELTTVSTVTTLQRMGLLVDFQPVEGGLVQRDIPLDLAADTTFTVGQALLALPAELVLGDLRLALALEQPSRRAVDVARDLGGNHAANGSDLVFTLPALTGPLAGHRWQTALQGSFPTSGYPASGSIASISARIDLPRPVPPLPGSLTSGSFTFLDFPTVTAPVTGDVVPASGFTVQYSLPPRALYGSIELRSDAVGGADALCWHVIVPPDLNQFTFTRLPAEAVTPLVAGRTYTLTVSAFRAQQVVALAEFPYFDLATLLQSVDEFERGVEQVSRRTIQITTN
ncbi:MAG TPA: hypothetical protein VFZ65_01735 [Planctomycetota bacterium]|nr:hypothetical protein [Planctomycetota bacterium]